MPSTEWAPAGRIIAAIVWHVVGLECSVREWAMRQGWDGRRVAPPHAQGKLAAALSRRAKP